MVETKVSPIPEGFTALTPHIVVRNCSEALEWYAKAFGAKTVYTMPSPDGSKLWHAEMELFGARLMLVDEFPDMGTQSPLSLQGTPVSLHLYVEDTDGLVKQVEAAGATVNSPPQDMFWGDRFAKLTDPYGHQWTIATHIVDPTPEEMQAAMAEMAQQG